MAIAHPAVDQIFAEALKIPPGQERLDFVHAACGANVELCERVERLLRAYGDAESFLERPAAAIAAATIDQPICESPGTVIGPYKLLEQIGEGGFGTVFMAEQMQPVRRKVALKVIKPGMDSRQVIARFEAERQALALMDHPNIAHVLDAGETASGRPYFVMDLIRGIPITEYCDRNQLAPRERLELFIPVCQAVQHAHQKGIVHRDLKPSNVLVTMHDGTPLVKIIDFGVAKALGQELTDKTLFTGFAQMIGTPLYLSPEQAELSALDIDTRSDIYSLGVLLYELLTGTTPFDKDRLKTAAYDEIRRLIREEEPPKPSTRISKLGETSATVSANRKSDPKRLSQLFRGDLDWIVMKALEKDRQRRYETANGLARDIERYLHDEPVEACPPSTVYRFHKYARRHKVAFVTATVVAATLLIGTGISTWQAIRAMQAERLADQRFEAEKNERQRAEKAEQIAQRRLYDGRLAQAKASRWSGRPGQRFESLRVLTEAAQLARELNLGPQAIQELRNEAIAALSLPDVQLIREWEAYPLGSSDGFDFDADLEHYARSDSQGNVSVRRVADDHELARLPPPAKTGGAFVDFNRKGDLLAARHGTDLRIWDWRQGAVVFEPPFPIASAWSFHPDGKRLALGQDDGSIILYELASSKEIGRLALAARPYHMAFHPQGNKLAVAWLNGDVEVRDVESGDLLRRLTHPTRAAHGVFWHPDGDLLAVSCSDFQVYLWDVATGRQHAVLRGHQSQHIGVHFSRRGDLFWTYSWDATTRLWNVWTGRELVRCSGTAACWSRDEQRLVTRLGSKATLWQVAPAREYRTLPNPAAAAKARMDFGVARIHPEGRWLTVQGSDGVRLWDLRTSKLVALLECGPVADMAFHPSGHELFISSPSGLYVWSFKQNEDVLTIGPPRKLPATPPCSTIALDLPGQTLATGNMSGVQVLDLVMSAPAGAFLPHAGAISVALSLDGMWLTAGTHNGLGVKVWEARSGKLVKDLLPEARLAEVNFSPDGRSLITNTPDGFTFWEVGSWEPTRRIAAEKPDLIAWTPDGKLMAVPLSPSRVQLQDPATQRPLATLEVSDDQLIRRLILSPDGTQLVVVNQQPPAVRVWDLRLIREQLAAMGLDWDAPPYGPVSSSQPDLVKVEVILQNPIERATRVKEAQGDKHRAQKEYAEAIACYREVLHSEPHNVGVGNTIAWLLSIGPAEVRNTAEAVKLSEQACELSPNHVYVVNTRGAVEYRAGEYVEALSSLRRAEKLAENDKGFAWPLNWLLQALCLARLGQLEAARDDYEKSVQWLKERRFVHPSYAHDAQLLRVEVEALLELKE